jgi:hypothetical protein
VLPLLLKMGSAIVMVPGSPTVIEAKSAAVTCPLQFVSIVTSYYRQETPTIKLIVSSTIKPSIDELVAPITRVKVSPTYSTFEGVS